MVSIYECIMYLYMTLCILVNVFENPKYTLSWLAMNIRNLLIIFPTGLTTLALPCVTNRT